jgi:hypothetical protein
MRESGDQRIRRQDSRVPGAGRGGREWETLNKSELPKTEDVVLQKAGYQGSGRSGGRVPENQEIGDRNGGCSRRDRVVGRLRGHKLGQDTRIQPGSV